MIVFPNKWTFLILFLTIIPGDAIKCNKCLSMVDCEDFSVVICNAPPDDTSNSTSPTENIVRQKRQSPEEEGSTEAPKESDIPKPKEHDADGCMFAHSGKGEVVSGCTEGPHHECIHKGLNGFRPKPCVLFNADQLKIYNACLKEHPKCINDPLCKPQDSLAFCFCDQDTCNDQNFLKKVKETHDKGSWVEVNLTTVLVLFLLSLRALF